MAECKIINMKVNFATFLERGVASTLDYLQEVCGVNAIRMQVGMHAPQSAWDPTAEFPCGGTGAPIRIGRYASIGVEPACILGDESDATRKRLWEEIRTETRQRDMLLMGRTPGPNREMRGVAHMLAQDPWGRSTDFGCYHNPHVLYLPRDLAVAAVVARRA